MKGELVPVILLPRFTTFTADAVYDTAPIDVSAYDRLVVDFNSSYSAVFDGVIEESHDGIEWFELASFDATTVVRVDLTRRWLRLVVSNLTSIVTCWCSGTLRRRVG